MAHNLDIEISALRQGWGEWCDDYQKLDEQNRALKAALIWLLDKDGYWLSDEDIPAEFRALVVDAHIKTGARSATNPEAQPK